MRLSSVTIVVVTIRVLLLPLLCTSLRSYELLCFFVRLVLSIELVVVGCNCCC